MKNNDQVLILYHSGAGSTKTIAEIYYEMLHLYSIELSPIKFQYDYQRLKSYQFLIFAFPTYHCSPSSSMVEFIQQMPSFEQPKKAFAFTTCGLYAGNALREFIKKCSVKNIIVNGYSTYRAPATDGVLLLPPLSFMFNYQKNIAAQIKRDINKIKELIKSDNNQMQSPAFKLYTILNYPNKLIGKAYQHKIKLLPENCTKCNRCIEDCIRQCWNAAGEFPQYQAANCECCFRCIHHCPSGAIVLSTRTKKRLKLNQKFYTNIKENIIQRSKGLV